MSSFSNLLHGTLINPLYKGILEFRRRGGFNIASTNPSAYYDRTVLATLFQDSAGTTPVTAGSQPIGLGLDQSQGLALGPELVTNGDFSNGSTGWSVGINWSIAGGIASCNGTGGDLYQGGLNSSKTYKVTFTVVSYTSGSLAVRNGGGFLSYGVGAHSVLMKDSLLVFQSSSYIGSITNISVKLLAGNHQSQATAGKRPLTAGSPIYANFDAVDDALVATFPASLGAGCTVCRSLPGTGASITTGVTLTATYTDNVDAHALLIYTAAQWAALDAGKIAKITAWLNGRAGL